MRRKILEKEWGMERVKGVVGGEGRKEVREDNVGVVVEREEVNEK